MQVCSCHQHRSRPNVGERPTVTCHDVALETSGCPSFLRSGTTLGTRRRVYTSNTSTVPFLIPHGPWSVQYYRGYRDKSNSGLVYNVKRTKAKALKSLLIFGASTLQSPPFVTPCTDLVWQAIMLQLSRLGQLYR